MNHARAKTFYSPDGVMLAPGYHHKLANWGVCVCVRECVRVRVQVRARFLFFVFLCVSACESVFR